MPREESATPFDQEHVQEFINACIDIIIEDPDWYGTYYGVRRVEYSFCYLEAVIECISHDAVTGHLRIHRYRLCERDVMTERKGQC